MYLGISDAYSYTVLFMSAHIRSIYASEFTHPKGFHSHADNKLSISKVSSYPVLFAFRKLLIEIL